MLIVIFIFALFGACFAQENVSTKEAGAYQRKSVAFLDFTVSKNENIPEQWEKEFANALQNSVRLSRFDYNNLPKNIADKFNALPPSFSIEERLNAAVVPLVLAAVDAQKEVRALELLSQQQKNSFITDIAKESGITEAELNAVMNAAYIFAPIYSGYSDTSYIETYRETYYYKDDSGNMVRGYRQVSRNVYQLNLDGGGYWWKIENAGEKPAVKIIARIERTSSGTSYPDSTYSSGYKQAAFRRALSGIADDVKNATMDISDFQYSGQILHKNIRNVIISIGKNEQIVVDDKFRVYESIEDANGNIVEKKRGWIMIKKVGEKARGLDYTQSKAQIISGMPYMGAVVREMPHFPFDVYMGFSKSPFSIDNKKQNESQRVFDEHYNELKNDYIKINKKEDTLDLEFENKKNELKDKYLYDIQGLKFSNMYGPELNFRQNISRSAKGESGSQWWVNIGAKFLFGDAGGTLRYNPYMRKDDWGFYPDDKKIEYEIDGAFAFEGDISFTKKIYIRRLAIAPELGFGIMGIGLSLQELDEYGHKKDSQILYDVKVSQYSLGLTTNLGVEIAITPFFNLGGSFGYNLFTRGSDSWKTSWRNKGNTVDTTFDNEGNVFEIKSSEEKYQDGPSVKSGDKLQTNGIIYTAYVSFTIPHNSNSNRRKDFAND
ncbi:MAG: hypothetical protein FWF51_03370 [Chitinivibrionia bacterium]|nr:hypothetical protein [Chitinivibrionia bacterium]